MSTERPTVFLDESTHTFYVRVNGLYMMVGDYLTETGLSFTKGFVPEGLVYIHQFHTRKELREWWTDPISGTEPTEPEPEFSDEDDDADTTGESAVDWWMDASELNEWYSQGRLLAQPVSGDATTIEKAGL